MDAPHCPQCQAAMEAATDICPSCGKQVVPQYTPEPAGDEPGVYLCYRHRKERTRLRCGRCGRAICTTCAMIGPAGPRCPECGRNRVPIRARGVAHDFTSVFRGWFVGPYRFIFAIVLISLVLSLLRGCAGMFSDRGGPAHEDRPTVESPRD